MTHIQYNLRARKGTAKAAAAVVTRSIRNHMRTRSGGPVTESDTETESTISDAVATTSSLTTAAKVATATGADRKTYYRSHPNMIPALDLLPVAERTPPTCAHLRPKVYTHKHERHHGRRFCMNSLSSRGIRSSLGLLPIENQNAEFITETFLKETLAKLLVVTFRMENLPTAPKETYMHRRKRLQNCRSVYEKRLYITYCYLHHIANPTTSPFNSLFKGDVGIRKTTTVYIPSAMYVEAVEEIPCDVPEFARAKLVADGIDASMRRMVAETVAEAMGSPIDAYDDEDYVAAAAAAGRKRRRKNRRRRYSSSSDDDEEVDEDDTESVHESVEDGDDDTESVHESAAESPPQHALIAAPSDDDMDGLLFDDVLLFHMNDLSEHVAETEAETEAETAAETAAGPAAGPAAETPPTPRKRGRKPSAKQPPTASQRRGPEFTAYEADVQFHYYLKQARYLAPVTKQQQITKLNTQLHAAISVKADAGSIADLRSHLAALHASASIALPQSLLNPPLPTAVVPIVVAVPAAVAAASTGPSVTEICADMSKQERAFFKKLIRKYDNDADIQGIMVAKELADMRAKILGRYVEEYVVKK